jgi:uncharacterized protein (TIGR02145 family)
MNLRIKNLLLIGSIFAAVIFSSCNKDDDDDLSGVTTPPTTGTTGTFNDSRDSITYKWVKIGDQVWMAENLNYDAGIYSWIYDNSSSNADIYGRLYTWEKAFEACPSGWHLPTDEEWKTLEIYLGMNQSEADTTGWRGTNEGSKLAGVSSLWHYSTTPLVSDPEFGTSGFSALPGGYINYYDHDSHYLGLSCFFWSATESSSTRAWSRALESQPSTIKRNSESLKANGFSVRCVKDN